MERMPAERGGAIGTFGGVSLEEAVRMRVGTWATDLDGEGWSEFGEACHDDEFIYYVIMLENIAQVHTQTRTDVKGSI